MGATGIVTGKHGGVANVMVDFPLAQMRRMRLGDVVQIYARGQGLRLLDFPDVAVMNADPALLARLGLRQEGRQLSVPATHTVPAALMGSGLGKSSAARGDYDIQLFDRKVVRRFRLDTLRFGDIVAIVEADGRYGRAYRSGYLTVGIVVHGDSTVAGHGPGLPSASCCTVTREPTSRSLTASGGRCRRAGPRRSSRRPAILPRVSPNGPNRGD
jgi:hypothetical protein